MNIKSLINKYRSFSFEQKTVFTAKFSIFSNAFFAVAKFILAIFNGVFFFVAGVLNIFMMIAKLECYLGIKKNNKEDFKQRNFLIGLFLIFAGLQYAIYMSRLIYSDVEVMDYNMIMGISIACISFVELGFAIKGIFNASGKGHYYRNIKLINLASAFTAIVLTEVALMSFASTVDTRLIDGLFGVVVGFINVLIGIFIIVAPKVSVVDREYNEFKAIDKNALLKDDIKIKLTNSKFYADFYFEGKIENDYIKGHIVKGKTPIWGWNIYLLILVITLSEILIFPYAIGALVNYFKGNKLFVNLDSKMLELGYKKVKEEESC